MIILGNIIVFLHNQSPFPSNHNPLEEIKYDINDNGNNIPEVSIHKKIMSLIIDISIFWLEETITWTRLHPFITSSHMIIHVWASYFPSSHPLHPPYNCTHIHFGICYMSNHTGRQIYIDMMICSLHLLYDYTLYWFHTIWLLE